MLYIIANTGEFTWHVGKKFPGVPGGAVNLVQADGDELDFIAQTMSGIPMHRGAVVTWHGDIAKFISANLPSVLRAGVRTEDFLIRDA